MKSLKSIDWKTLALRVKAQAGQDNLMNGAAAIGFYLMLALFPGLIFLLSILPYLPIPRLEQAIMDLLHQGMPEQAAGLLQGTVESLVQQRQGGLLSLGLLGTLWAASNGMMAVMRQLNQTYQVEESRSFFKARGTALAMTLLFGLLVVGGMTLVVGGGVLQNWLAQATGLGPAVVVLFAVVRWVIIVLVLMLAFSLFYYLGPNVDQDFKWVSPGAVIGVPVLILASLGFRFYITNFGNYDATYGGIGAVIILMMWLFVASLVLLLGSEINIVFENFAREDEGGRPRPSERAQHAMHR